MKKITVKQLIEFRGKKDKPRLTFVRNLKKEKEKKKDGSGGDYWVSCVTGVGKAFKEDDIALLDAKVAYLEEKIEAAEKKGTKDRHKKNLEIVDSFNEYDFNKLKPNLKLSFLKIGIRPEPINIKKVPVEVKPSYAFSFSDNGSDEVGGVWFIAKKDGFRREELGMFTEMLYRYLKQKYSNDFFVNPEYCTAVDLVKAQEVNYTQLTNGQVPILVDMTLDDLTKLL